jgi:hypothetical protein
MTLANTKRTIQPEENSTDSFLPMPPPEKACRENFRWRVRDLMATLRCKEVAGVKEVGENESAASNSADDMGLSSGNRHTRDVGEKGMDESDRGGK